MIEENITRGRVHEAMPAIRRKLNGYLRLYDRIKIGATTNPETRWSLGHEGDGWDKMVLVYESEWAGSTRSMERGLIAYARGTNFRVELVRRDHGAAVHAGGAGGAAGGAGATAAGQHGALPWGVGCPCEGPQELAPTSSTTWTASPGSTPAGSPREPLGGEPVDAVGVAAASGVRP